MGGGHIEAGSPLHRENRESDHKKNPCQGMHREFDNFGQTQKILFAQVVNSLKPKIKDIAIFAAKFQK